MDYNFNEFLTNHFFLDFNKKMIDFAKCMSISHTMVGFNYTKDEILSTKFYYAFYGVLPESSLFPIIELRDEYDRLLPYYSKEHLFTKYLPGGGLTLTIKFDNKSRESVGFYVRLNKDNSELKAQAKEIYSQFELEDIDFEDGYGQYIMLDQNKITNSQYVYLKNGRKISNLYGIPFDKASSVELSAIKTNGSASSKLIAIGTSELLTSEFYKNIPSTLLNLNPQKLVCPAVNLDSKQYSIYNFSMFNPENNPNELSNHVFI